MSAEIDDDGVTTYPPLLVHPLESGGAIVGIIIEIVEPGEGIPPHPFRGGQATLHEALRFDSLTNLVEIFEWATAVPLEPRATFTEESFWTGCWVGSQLRRVKEQRKTHQMALQVLDEREQKLRRMTNHWAELDARDQEELR